MAIGTKVGSLAVLTRRAEPSGSPSPSPSSRSESAAVDIDALYRQHAPAVLRWAGRLGGPALDADDIVQDVFLIAKRRLTSFEGPGQVTTWLFRTTQKVVQTARRKQRMRRWLSLSSEANITTMSASQPNPGESLQRDRDVAEVYRVLDRLPERERHVMILFELEGLSTQEIGALTGSKVGTVRVWLFRARERFQVEHRRLYPREGEKVKQ